MTESECGSEMVMIRKTLAMGTPTPAEQKTLCARNCELVGIAVEEGWEYLVTYGCETDTLYCGGTCPHCGT